MSNRFDPDALLSPMQWETFFSSWWERRYLHISGRGGGYYDALATVHDLEELLSRSDSRYPAVRLAKDGGYFASETYTRSIRHGDESFTGVVDVQRIADEYRQGATVAMPAIHRTWTPLAMLCDALQAKLDHAAHANVYITPGNAKGFTPHYDVHEVFVLQIAGTKHWQLYEPVVQLPHRSQLFRPELYSGQTPMAEIELNAGDLLYLPRGVLHATTTADVFSAHVTVGITVYTWADLIKEMLNSAIDNDDMRKALPPGFATNDALRPQLNQTIRGMWNQLSPDERTGKLIDSFRSRVRAAQVRQTPVFQADLTVIDLDSRLQAPSSDAYEITQESDKTMLKFKDTRYQMPAPVATTVRSICQLRTFRPADLIGPLDSGSALALSRHLVDIGFLTILPARSTP